MGHARDAILPSVPVREVADTDRLLTRKSRYVFPVPKSWIRQLKN